MLAKPRTPAADSMWLLVAVAVAASLLGPLAYGWDGLAGLLAVALAAAVCLVAGTVGSLLSHASHSRGALAGLLVGMLARMAIPMGVCLLVYGRGGMLAEANFAIYVLVFYLITLAVETWLSLDRMDALQQAGKES